MAISNRPWGDITAADYADADAYCRACLVDLNPNPRERSKDACKLPVREPNGDLNRNAVHAVAVALAGGRTPLQLPAMQKSTAARKLVALYGQLDEEPPDSVKRLAGLSTEIVRRAAGR
jgi:hypothetical protein